MVNRFSKELIKHVEEGGFIDCKDIHDFSCEKEALVRFGLVFKLAAKFYLPIHLIPALILKRKVLKTKPLQVLKSFLNSYLRSSIMLAAYIMIFRYGMCTLKNIR